MEHIIDKTRKKLIDELYNAFEIISENPYIYLCDIEYNYFRCSEEAAQFFGLPGEYMVGGDKIWAEHIHPDDRKDYDESICAIFEGKEQWHDMQYRARNRNGDYVVCTCRGTVIHNQDGKPAYFLGAIQNHNMVNNIDSLTGFQNQYGLFEHLNVLYSKKSKANIMMIGIDHFSIINEMWGYDFGNIVIHKLVQMLKKEFQNEGILYRTDGVRFVLLTHTISMQELEKRYDIVKKNICHTLEVDGYHPNLLVYGSAMEIRTFDINPQTMFSCLEYSYTLAREQRNSSLHIFRNEIDEGRSSMLELINDIRKSIENDCLGFMLYYQPTINSGTHSVHGAEALLRWENSKYGMVSPGRFIPIIENDPAFAQLGKWILNRAMADARDFLKQYPEFKLNVNVSYQQLEQDDFVEMVKEALDVNEYPPQNLCLEMTERCRLVNENRLESILSELRQMGICFAIDDFGTGYSSMNILTQLKFEVVKIDKKYVDHITEKTRDEKLVSIVNDLATTCGATVCVEGVETKYWDCFPL